MQLSRRLRIENQILHALLEILQMCTSKMRKSIFFLIILLFSYMASQLAYSEHLTGNLKVVVSGLKVNRGLVSVGLYNDRKSFLSRGTMEPFLKAKATVEDYRAEYIFKDIPYGEYTIKFYHDENNNGRIDFDFLHIPIEPYGFSNNAKGFFGLPKYSKAKFEMKIEEAVMDLTLR